MLPRFFFLNIGLSETPYPALSGSNTINSYVYSVELLSVKSLVIHDSRAEVQRFMIPKFLSVS